MPVSFKRILFLGLLTLLSSAPDLSAQDPLARFNNPDINAEFNEDGIRLLSTPQDKYAANIVAQGSVWGDLKLLYRINNGDWINHYNWDEKKATALRPDKVLYSDYKVGVPVKVERIFEKSGNGIDWTIRVQSMTSFPVSIGEIALPFNWVRPAGDDPKRIFEQCFTKHQHIAGNGSYLYFTRPSGEGPFLLVMTKSGTRLEYFESKGQYQVFIHSQLASGKEKRGSWRLQNSSVDLAPAGKPGSEVEYGLRFQWVSSYAQMREVLYENGLLDIRVVPGMTLPTGQRARFSIRTKNKIDSIVAEFPKHTEIRLLEEKATGHHIYEVVFYKLGENLLTIHYNGKEQSILEWFVTEPIETLIKKRSAFLVRQQQHRDSSKWYNGLYSEWDMANKVLRGPDDTDGFNYWWGYVLASDDPGLCKAPFLAAKNVYQPVPEEISSLEYYVQHFVWGGLQRTDKEAPNPYGIYGVPNWHVNRDSSLRIQSRDYNLDKMKIWRSYDYPHIFMLYYHLFQIAEYYPDQVHYLTAKGYLERAFQTAKAYFTYPYRILPWYDTYKWGCYNELVLIPLIADLERYGRKSDADFLRGEWEKKVKYFVYDDKYPFRSEYSIDRTAFESSYAFAKYGSLSIMKPDNRLWYDVKLKKWYSHPKVDQSDSRSFMDRQLAAGLAVRGWLTPAYYSLGSDDSETGGLSYMARMGGWGILDYALRFAEHPDDWLQLGYASYLSSYALINSGTPESNYGYWFPGKENDGANGWAFNSQKYGRTWLQDRNNPRGAWNYDGEADLGNGAIPRTAASIITKDALFGWVAYGGNLQKDGDSLKFVPQDGMNIRFAFVDSSKRLIVELSRDRFSSSQPIIASVAGRRFLLPVMNVTGKAHKLELKFSGTKGTAYSIRLNGRKISTKKLLGAEDIGLQLLLPVQGAVIELLEMKQ